MMKPAAVLMTALSLTIAGCSDFLDVNDNPNNSTEVNPTLVLPSGQAGIAIVLGNHYQVNGGIWAQFWTQNRSSSQYRSVDGYYQTASSFDRPWQILYADAMVDLQKVINQGGVPTYRQHAAIGMILKAYDLQMLTDAFGDIPNREALLGEDEANIAPAYDSQESVYDSIFALLDRAEAIADPSYEFQPGPEDLIFGGDMAKWEAFANTLELRAYLRLAYVAPDKARAGIEKLAGATFLTENASMTFIGIGGNQNPLYAEMVGYGLTQNLVASETAVDTMKALNDPRLYAYYQPGADTTAIIAIPQGSFFESPIGNISFPGPVTGADPKNAKSATAPVVFISAAESYFLQAEAISRGWLQGDARSLFQQGITASFTSLDVAPGNYITNAVAAWPAAGFEAQLEAIITQKYFAMDGLQGFEAWTEYRRTGYPRRLIVSPESLLDPGEMPERFLYPNVELTRNPKFPGAKTLVDKVWWDVKP